MRGRRSTIRFRGGDIGRTRIGAIGAANRFSLAKGRFALRPLGAKLDRSGRVVRWRRFFVRDEHNLGTFAVWLAELLPKLKVQLDIPRAARFCDGVHGEFCGLEAVVTAYDWKARWTDADGNRVESQDWMTTKASLGKLREGLRGAVFSDTETNDAMPDASSPA